MSDAKRIAIFGAGMLGAISDSLGFNVLDAAVSAAAGPRVADKQCAACVKKNSDNAPRWCSEWRQRPRACSLKRSEP